MLGQKVVVTTAHRGVFFGTLKVRDDVVKTVHLEDARNCVYWSSSTRGFLGLAKTGPLNGSKIGPHVPRLDLFDVTSITECTDEAVSKWEEGPWS